MTRRIFVLLIFVIVYCKVNSQTTHLELVSPAGESFLTPKFIVDFSIGEVVIGSNSNLNTTINHGFNQILFGDIFKGYKKIDKDSLLVKIYPNPFIDCVNVNFKGKVDKVSYIIVRSITGNLLLKESAITNSLVLNLSRFNDKVYFLTIYDVDDNIMKSITLVKK